MARNGIVDSGYYDLDLGSIGSPAKGFCHLPEGKFISIFHLIYMYFFSQNVGNQQFQLFKEVPN